jgi:hypothetical protein
MKWNYDVNGHAASDFEDLAYSPSGGRTKLILLGILLPLIIAYFGVDAWVTEKAIWFGQGNSKMIVHGQTAKALAVTYLSVGLFCHFRWCWGLIPCHRLYEIGTIISLLGILGGIAYGFYTLFFV